MRPSPRLLNPEVCSDSSQLRTTGGRTNILRDNCPPVTRPTSGWMARLIQIIYSCCCCCPMYQDGSAKIARALLFAEHFPSRDASRRRQRRVRPRVSQRSLVSGAVAHSLLRRRRGDTVINAARHQQACLCKADTKDGVCSTNCRGM